MTSIVKNVTNSSGTLLESDTYYYNYQHGKIVSYGMNSDASTLVSYNELNKILNLGFGNDLEYYDNGLLKIDPYGVEFVYNGSNVTGTSNAPNLYAYDTKDHPFLNNSEYFKLIFEHQFQAYYSDDIMRAANNITSEATTVNPLNHEIQYNQDELPLNVVITYSGASEVMEQISYQYIEL